MRSLLNLLLSCALGAASHQASAQGGIRLVIWDYEFIQKSELMGNFGLGYDHDLHERLSFCIQARYGVSDEAAWSVDYRSAYHFADNDGPSFYMGPQVGVRHWDSPEPFTYAPVGMRFGVRGGLERFYADLFGGFQLNIGAPKTSKNDYTRPDIAPTTLVFGIHMGWGWDKDDGE